MNESCSRYCKKEYESHWSAEIFRVSYPIPVLHLLEPLGVAHRGIGLQRALARFQFGALFLQLRELALRFVKLLLSGGEGLLGGGEVPAQPFVAALR